MGNKKHKILPPNHPDTFGEDGYVKDEYNQFKMPKSYDLANEMATVLSTYKPPTKQQIKNIAKRWQGMKDVEEYCFKNGLFPSDLVQFHIKNKTKI